MATPFTPLHPPEAFRPEGHHGTSAIACTPECQWAASVTSLCTCEGCGGVHHGRARAAAERATVSTPASQAKAWSRLPAAPSDDIWGAA